LITNYKSYAIKTKIYLLKLYKKIFLKIDEKQS